MLSCSCCLGVFKMKSQKMRQVYHRGNQTLGLTSYTFLLDVINIARHCHLSLGDILIKAAAVTLSIWIHVDKTENSSSRLMTQCRRHSDLNLNSPAIKGLVRHSTLHLIICGGSAFIFLTLRSTHQGSTEGSNRLGFA